MSTSRTLQWVVVLAAAGALLGGGIAAWSKEPEKGAAAGAPAGQPQMTEQEMMEAYANAAAPNEHHRNMAKMVGNWNTVVKYWPAPGAPPQEMKGSATFRSLLDGRYIQLDYKGEMDGKPFAGVGTFAYDKGRKKHTSTWIDSMSTGFLSSQADCEKNCSVIKGSGEYWDPISGQKITGRELTHWEGDNTMVHEMFGPSQDGKVKEFKMMEITYTRASS